MIRLLNRSILFFAVILMGILFVSCLDGGSSQRRSTGTLELSLIDGPGTYSEVHITIIDVQVHHETDGWVTLSGDDLNLPLSVNLLDLVNGTVAYLGATELEPGHYTQMRLLLDDTEGANYLVEDEGTKFLKIPSGFTTGVKLVNGFDIEVAGSTELILDFDVDKSIVVAGNSGKYLLKPTIKVVDSFTNSVAGDVRDESTNLLSGAKISAQEYDDTAINEIERVVVAASTTTDEFGNYFMYLPLLPPEAPPYNIIATLEGYIPACIRLPNNEGRNITGEHEALFTLNLLGETPESKVTFVATIEGLFEDDVDPGNNESVTISIRQDYGDPCGWIEITSFNLGNIDSEELITLPAGDYLIVVTSEDVSVPDPIEVIGASGSNEINLDFTPSP